MSTRRTIWLALLIVALAAAVRYSRLSQSLWLDEMTTLDHYVERPWHATLAGAYVPNNHVLHTILAKAVYPSPPPDAPLEPLLRVPSWVAGSLLPIALAWPLRRRTPRAAVAVAVAVAVHPWLVDLGAEARGYSLMLLLAVVATNLLPTPTTRRRGILAYALALAAAIYTVPLAVLLVPAHALAVLTRRPPKPASEGTPEDPGRRSPDPGLRPASVARLALRRWASATTLALALATVLYLPMARSLLAYYRHPYPPTTTRADFWDAVPRLALAGERLPHRPLDPLTDRPPDPPAAAIFWALPVLILTVGTAVAWPRYPDARPLLATLAVATALAVLMPLLIRSTAEPRFATWAAPWFCLAAVLLLLPRGQTKMPSAPLSRHLRYPDDPSPSRISTRGLNPGRVTAAVGLTVLLVQCVIWDADPLPNQPVREAMQWADAHAPPDRAIVVASVGSVESVDCYAGDAPHHGVVAAPTPELFAQLLADGRRRGRLPWIILPFEAMARDRDGLGIWQPMRAAGYRRAIRLDGRIMPVGVYAPPGGPPV